MADGSEYPDPRTGKSNNKTLWIILGVCGGVLLLSCICCVPVGVGLLLPAMQKVREAADRTVRANELHQVGMAIHSFHDTNKRMPASFDDLKPVFGDAKVRERVGNKEIEVIWNAVSFKDEDRGPSTVLIGWDNQPTGNNQRQVLFMDGSVQTISEEQFRKTPRVRTIGEKK